MLFILLPTLLQRWLLGARSVLPCPLTRAHRWEHFSSSRALSPTMSQAYLRARTEVLAGVVSPGGRVPESAQQTEQGDARELFPCFCLSSKCLSRIFPVTHTPTHGTPPAPTSLFLETKHEFKDSLTVKVCFMFAVFRLCEVDSPSCDWTTRIKLWCACLSPTQIWCEGQEFHFGDFRGCTKSLPGTDTPVSTRLSPSAFGNIILLY